MNILHMTKPGEHETVVRRFAAALGDGFDVVMWAPDRPFAGQVKGAVAVVDMGTSRAWHDPSQHARPGSSCGKCSVPGMTNSTSTFSGRTASQWPTRLDSSAPGPWQSML